MTFVGPDQMLPFRTKLFPPCRFCIILGCALRPRPLTLRSTNEIIAAWEEEGLQRYRLITQATSQAGAACVAKLKIQPHWDPESVRLRVCVCACSRCEHNVHSCRSNRAHAQFLESVSCQDSEDSVFEFLFLNHF